MKELNNDRELNFVSGKFFDFDLPKEKRYLLKYFKNESQIQFLKYYFTFDGDINIKYFSRHTGYVCSERWLFTLRNKIRTLERVHDKARKDLDSEKLSLIKSGKLKYKAILRNEGKC